MVFRILEAVFGLAGSLFGIWMAVIEGRSEARGSSGATSAAYVLVLFGVPFLGIAVGSLLHLLVSLRIVPRWMHLAGGWAALTLLWLSTLTILVIIYLSLPSIGVLFIPGAVLVLIACVLAVIPSSLADNPRNVQ